MLHMMEEKILHFVNFIIFSMVIGIVIIIPGFAFTFEYLHIYCLFIDTGCQRKN